MTSTESTKVPIHINVVSDTICPWCYVGYKNLLSAIKRAGTEKLSAEFIIKYDPYFLNPNLPSTPIEKREYYRKRFGVKEFEQMENRMVKVGKQVGIEFSYDGMIRNTLDSHRLLTKAYQVGGEKKQRPVLESLFKGYFENAKDIGCVEYLASVGVEHGVFDSTDSALTYFKSQETVDEVKRHVQAHHRKEEIKGVPTTFIHKTKGGSPCDESQQYQLGGAQPADEFFKVFEKIVSESNHN